MALFPEPQALKLDLDLRRRVLQHEDIGGYADARASLIPMDPEVPADVGDLPQARDPCQEQELQAIAGEIVQARFRHSLLREHPVLVDQVPGVMQLDSRRDLHLPTG